MNHRFALWPAVKDPYSSFPAVQAGLKSLTVSDQTPPGYRRIRPKCHKFVLFRKIRFLVVKCDSVKPPLRSRPFETMKNVTLDVGL